MAGKRVERFVERQIREQGGWDWFFRRDASGERLADIARTLYWPNEQMEPNRAKPIDRSTLSHMVHGKPERRAQYEALHPEHLEARIERTSQRLEEAPADNAMVQREAKSADLALRIAGLRDERWRDKKAGLEVTVNVGSMHLDALRHRVIEASRPLAAELGQVVPIESKLLADRTSPSHVPPARDTVTTVPASAN